MTFIIFWLVGTFQHETHFILNLQNYLYFLPYQMLCDYLPQSHTIYQDDMQSHPTDLNNSTRMLWIELNFGSKIFCVLMYRTCTPLSATLSSTQKLCRGL